MFQYGAAKYLIVFTSERLQSFKKYWALFMATFQTIKSRRYLLIRKI